MKAVMPATLALVPPLATGSVPVTPAERLTCEQVRLPFAAMVVA